MHLTRAFLLSLAGLLGTSAAHAQSRGAATGWADTSEPGGDWYFTESLDLRGALRPAAGVLLDYSYPPATVRGAQLVRDRVAMHLRGALVIGDRLRIGASMPAVVFQHGNALVDGGGVILRAGERAAFGDLRLTSDARVFGTYTNRLRGAVGLAVTLPTGSRDQYTSDGVVKVAPRIMLAGNFHDLVGAVKLGMTFRTATPDFAGRELGHDAFVAASAGIKVNDRFVLGPEILATATVTGANALSKRSFPVELLLGGRIRVADDFQIGSSIGGTVTSADGAPSLRILALAEWTPDPCVDKDGDGICATEDACPTADGVRTNDPRTNGCPLDRDRDGVPDRIDRCPDSSGPRREDAATTGCPDAHEEAPPGADDPETPQR